MRFTKRLFLILLFINILSICLGGICELCQCSGEDSSIIKCERKNDFDNGTEIFNLLPFSNTETTKELSVKKYELKSLSLDAFRGLKKLRSLDLSENSINDVEATVFKELIHLEVLDFSSNRLKILKEAIFNIESLLFLNLSRNLIDDLNSTETVQLLKLTTLDLSHNNLENIDSKFIESLKNLQFFDVSFNNIVSISPETLSKLDSLYELRLNDNRLKIVSGDYFPKSLRILNIAGNNFDSLPQNLSQIHDLNVANNTISEIDSSASWLKELRYLNMSKNSLTTFSRILFDHLQILDLSMNNFEVVPKELSSSKLPSLEILIIDGNPIENLQFTEELSLRKISIRRVLNLKTIRSDAFVKLKGTNDQPIDLIISDNPRLNYIEKGVFDDVSINTLDLSENAFTTMPLEIIKPDNAYVTEKGIDLQGNPFHCDCQLQWMLNDFVPYFYKVNPHLLENLRCATPVELSGIRMVHFYQWKKQVFCEKHSERLSRMSVIAASTSADEKRSIMLEPSRGMLVVIAAAMATLCIFIVVGIIIARKLEIRKRRTNRRF